MMSKFDELINDTFKTLIDEKKNSPKGPIAQASDLADRYTARKEENPVMARIGKKAGQGRKAEKLVDKHNDNVLKAAEQNKIKKVIVLSTDKAAYPINAMGMTKALMEKVMVANSRALVDSETVLCGTRFGNVMASRGSVIPLFINQIKKGQDITLTNPKMTRFMMSLSMAVKLVDFAFKNANQGDILVQKSPACTLQTLADALIEIFGAKSKIKNIGIRHGEKMHETLLSMEEMNVSEDLGNYFRIPADNRDLNYDKYFLKGMRSKTLEEFNSYNTKRLEEKELIHLLASIGYK